MIDNIVSVNEAAQMLGVTRMRVYHMITSGALPARKLNQKAFAIRLSDVARLKEHREKKGIFTHAR